MRRSNGKLTKSLIIFIFTIIITFISFPVNAEAKTAKPKVKSTAVTLYTNSADYTIELKNTDKKAKVTYSSADKSVVAVSKKGIVKVKGEGKTTVTVKIVQNSETYKSKITFTVKKPYIKFSKTPIEKMKAGETQTIRVKGYGTETSGFKFKSSDKSIAKISSKGKLTAVAPGKVKITVSDSTGKFKCSTEITVLPDNTVADRLLEIATEQNNKNYNQDYLCETPEEFEKMIFDIYSQGYYPVLLVQDLSIVPEENYFLEKYVSLTSFTYDYCIKYLNGYAIKVILKPEISMFTDEFLIDCALTTGDTSLLTDDYLNTYNKVINLADNLKGDTEEETVKNIHDYLVLNHAYPTYFRDTEDLHRLAGTIDTNYCVCDGYAKCFYFLCKASGIDVMLVHGDASSSPNRSELHSWNKVKIDGEWYNMDVTWDDPCPDRPGEISYNYYCITDETISVNHIWDNTLYPAATSKKLGPIYEYETSGIPIAKTRDEFKAIINSVADETVQTIKKSSGHKSIDLQVIAIFGLDSDDLYDNLLNPLLYSCNSDYNLGFKSSYKTIGPVGTLFEFTLYN